MPVELTFRISLALLLTLILTIRTYYQLSARKSRGRFTYREPRWQVMLKSWLAAASMSTLLVYLAYPGWLNWAALDLPLWLRWTGASLGLVAAGLHWWSHYTLSDNFAPFLHIREQHTLISWGAYRWIRHPLYTAFFITGLTWFLLAANWFIGLVWAGFALAVVCQVNTEEMIMIEKFGEQYRRYRQSTGQFLPRFGSFK